MASVVIASVVIALATGFLSLVLQTTLLRLGVQELGGNRSTSAAILATALLGLAIGAAWFGDRADKSRSQGTLPCLLLGLASITTILLAFLARSIASGISNFCADASIDSNLAPLLFALVVILPVHIFAGGVIPSLAALRSAKSDDGATGVRKIISLLYSVETIGVASGALLAVFFLIPLYGIRETLITCGGLGLIVSCLGLLALRRFSSQEDLDEANLTANRDATEPKTTSKSGKQSAILLLAVLASSFASLGMELIWQRFFVVLYGSDTRSYAVVVAATLIGIAIGSWLSGLKIVRTKSHMAYGINLIAVSSALSLSLLILNNGLQVETMRASLEWLLLTPFYARLLLAIFVVLLPATCMGFAIPLVSELWVQSNPRVGSGIGRLFAVVALGNVAGIFCSASFLIPELGLFKSAAFLALLPFVAGLAIMTLYQPPGAGSPIRNVLAIVAAAFVLGQLILLSLFTQPARPGSIGLEQWSEVFYFEDGNHTVAVTESAGQEGRRRLLIDGVTVGDSGGGVDEKQRLLAHLPFLLTERAEPQKVYTIGLGTGILASELAGHPCVETVIAAELSEGVIDAIDLFSDVNQKLTSNRKVQIINDDGIRFLRKSLSKFDVIASDGKSRPGAASNLAFFSREYYQICDSKLADNGLFVQWVSIKCAEKELASILKTFAGVFPFGHVGFATPGSVYLVGSKREIEFDPERINRHLKQKNSSSLHRYGWASSDDIQSMYWMDQGVLDLCLDDRVQVNTYDKPVLELYAWDSFQHSVQLIPPQLALLEKLIACDTESILNGRPIGSGTEGKGNRMVKARLAAKEILAANKLSLERDADWLDNAAVRWKNAIAHLPELHRQHDLAQQYRVLAQQAVRDGNQTTEFSALLNLVELKSDSPEDRLRIAQIFEYHGAFDQALPHHYAAVEQAEGNSRFRIAFAECLMMIQKYGQASHHLTMVLEKAAEPSANRKAELLIDICRYKTGNGNDNLLEIIMLQAAVDSELSELPMKFQILVP